MRVVEFSACGAWVKGYLWEPHPALTAHTVRPALIVCPGGGYDHLSAREGDPVALEFSAAGYQVFVLSYSVGEEAANYQPLRQLAQTVAFVRENAALWQIDPEKIAVMGFSAGGHLAASLGCYWNGTAPALPSGCRPDAMVLCYPVITMGEFTHAGTRRNVTGGDPAMEEVFSLEQHIGPDFPPTFLWHTVEDGSVPVENSLLLLQALRKNHVPFESHLFAHGPHGLSVCTREVGPPAPDCRPWLSLCKTWLNGQFDYEP